MLRHYKEKGEEAALKDSATFTPYENPEITKPSAAEADYSARLYGTA